MAHTPEQVEMYVCTGCQVVHAGTPVHLSGSDHRFDPPEECHVCGEAEFVSESEWVRHHK